MNILILSELFYPHGGGAEIATFLQCKLLAEKGVKVIVVTHKFQGEKRNERLLGFKIFRIPLFPNDTLDKELFMNRILRAKPRHKLANFVRKISNEESTDVIHTNRKLLVTASRMDKIAKVYTLHDFWPLCYYSHIWDGESICDFCSGTKILKCISSRRGQDMHHLVNNFPNQSLLENAVKTGLCISRFLITLPEAFLASELTRSTAHSLTKMNKIVAVSQELMGKVRNFLKLDDNKIKAIYNPLPSFPYCAPKKSGNSFSIAYLGGINRNKGFYNLIQAFAKAVRSNRKLRLVVAGGKGNFVAEHLISVLDLRSFVELRPRFPWQMLPEFIKDVDVVVVPSLWFEALPYASIDAMVCGRPVLANSVGGIKELVKNGVNGFLIDCYDIDLFSKEILEISSMAPEDLIEMGKQGREYIARKIDSEKEIHKLIKVYEEAHACN